jgi:hypothetical protein
MKPVGSPDLLTMETTTSAALVTKCFAGTRIHYACSVVMAPLAGFEPAHNCFEGSYPFH